MKVFRLMVLAVAGAVLAAPSVAQADTQSYTDPAGDAADFVTQVVAPEAKVGDIIDVHLDFAKSGLTAKITTRALKRSLEDGVLLVIRDSKGRRTMMAGGRTSDGSKDVDVERGGKPIKCGVKVQFDWAAKTTTLTAPSKCFGKVSWIRVGALAFAGTDSGDSGQFYVDDSRRNGEFSPKLRLKLGPRLQKG